MSKYDWLVVSIARIGVLATLMAWGTDIATFDINDQIPITIYMGSDNANVWYT